VPYADVVRSIRVVYPRDSRGLHSLFGHLVHPGQLPVVGHRLDDLQHQLVRRIVVDQAIRQKCLDHCAPAYVGGLGEDQIGQSVGIRDSSATAADELA
jgi:hypothetical protein